MNGRYARLRSRGRQPVTQVSRVTTIPLNPAASARRTRLAASSRSVGVYSWKKPGVSPNRAATSSMGSWERVEAIIGTPVRAAASAVARSPCRSCEHRPTTPTGAIISGEGRRTPHRSTPVSRSAAPTNMRGYRPQRWKAVALAFWVCSSPAPPATSQRVKTVPAPSVRLISNFEGPLAVPAGQSIMLRLNADGTPDATFGEQSGFTVTERP